jgi:short-subunit dehydrogenase
MTGDKIAEILAVNLAAPIELTQRLLPRMTARGSGRIVFVSSIVGATSVREEAVYSAAKAAWPTSPKASAANWKAPAWASA